MGSSGRHLATDDVPFIACIHGVRFAVFLNYITYKSGAERAAWLGRRISF